MKVSRDRMEKVCAQYEKERDHYKKKMNEATDEKKKKKYEELYKQYKSDLNKLEMYRDELYTEKENEKKNTLRKPKKIIMISTLILIWILILMNRLQ